MLEWEELGDATLTEGGLNLRVTGSGSNCHHTSPSRMRGRAEGCLSSVLGHESNKEKKKDKFKMCSIL